MLRVLKDSELAQPIAQYCSRPVVHAAQPVPSMPREQAILPDDMNIILNQQACPKSSGYCMLENGGGYLTVKSTLPGVTKEMLQWMVAWHGLEPVHYMAINGETHHSSAVSEPDGEKIGRSFLTMEEKSQGISVYTVDLIGGSFRTPSPTPSVPRIRDCRRSAMSGPAWSPSAALSCGSCTVRPTPRRRA